MPKIYRLLLIALAMSVPATAMAIPVYKYDLVSNGVIAERCLENGKPVSSKLNVAFLNKSKTSYKTRLKVKACTHSFGLNIFAVNLDLPVALFTESTLLAVKQGTSVKVGALTLTRSANQNSQAVFSVNPSVLGPQADGIRTIKFFVPLEKNARARLLALTKGYFMWSAVNVVYKKGVLMPTVNLNGGLAVVADEVF